MKTQDVLHNTLRLDYQSYDDYRFTCFINWCEIYVECGIPLRVLVNSQALYNWYCDQWIMNVEKPFINDNSEFINANISEPIKYIELLSTYPQTIEGFYPKVIIETLQQQLKLQKNDTQNLHQARTGN